jgi:putative FmdB family regulatory protein
MPIYEFSCEDCGGSFETLVRPGHDEDAAACPSCNSVRLSREMSVFASARGGDGAAAAPISGASPTRGGGCCGGGCGCH